MDKLLPKDKTLYEVLQLGKDADAKAIKSQYRRLALKFHPDKQPTTASDEEKQAATEQFQLLGLAYAILSDTAKRTIYDHTGRIDSDDDSGKDWNAYFKELWTGVVNEETIEAQKKKYQGSEEEKKDVLRYYEQCQGDMDKMLTYIECSAAADAERFSALIQEAIDANQVQKLKHFTKTTSAAAHQRRLKAEQKQRKQFEKEQAKEEGKGKKKKDDDAGSNDLAALIAARNKDRQGRMESVLASIEAQASAGKKRRRRGGDSPVEEPSEEEFQRIQQKMMKNKNKTT
ncbi:hypothetical protein BCR43DRAFT_480374 [Syncephalastrum racemosum]|uniref:J domain-containing protein n=1 Tax=Syncephalastrum racemosum TaxID=13706 RepID=A0A1X2H178_SYNRA|nr:hypothetical protein BCR43DRAFT_480374 [Syncephalastrum racemosum]